MAQIGSSIRTIKLVERLGHGGMGEVYLGVDERLQRKVAVKAIRSERRLDSATRARFLREARILSQLEHPNICRLYDYIEQDGEDFLILELVHGKSLRELVTAGLPYATRLAIAIQVASALAAAHALSVAHRDLKPENVMVGEDGAVKVLDFGLARPVAETSDEAGATEGDGAAAPLTFEGTATVTQLGALLGTPRYMSPEQARGEPATAASDMYAFGLLLQELFTGQPPMPTDLPRAVLLQKAMWGETLPVAGVTPPVRALVEALKSLTPKDRPDAAAAAERLRWIADEPRRRVRRITATGVAAALLVAAVVSSVGFIRARRAQARAEESERTARKAQAQAEAVNTFLRDMLSSADPRQMGIDVKVAEVLDRAGSIAERSFAGDAVAHAAVLDTLGSTYHALGDFQKAQPLLERALAARRRELGDGAPDTLATRHRLGVLLADETRYADAERTLADTLEGRRRILGEENPDTLETMVQLGLAYQRNRKFKDAEPLCRRALEVRQRTLGADHPATLQAMRYMARLHYNLDRWDEAEALLQPCLEKSRTTLGPTHPDTLAVIDALGTLYYYQWRWADAEPFQRESFVHCRKVLGPEHLATLAAARSLASSLTMLKRFDEADALLREAMAVSERVLGPAHNDTLEATKLWGTLAAERGDGARAERIYRERWAVAGRYLGEEDRVTLQAWSLVALQVWQNGRLAEAEAMYRQILEKRSKIFGEEGDATRNSKRYLIALLRDAGRSDEANAIEATLPLELRKPPNYKARKASP